MSDADEKLAPSAPPSFGQRYALPMRPVRVTLGGRSYIGRWRVDAGVVHLESAYGDLRCRVTPGARPEQFAQALLMSLVV